MGWPRRQQSSAISPAGELERSFHQAGAEGRPQARCRLACPQGQSRAAAATLGRGSLPPTYEALVGDLRGAFSRRLNIQHRLVYQVLREEKIVKVLRLWTHYE